MPLKFIGPAIAIAVNLPLAVWALVQQARNASYRTFALLAASLVTWNLGGEVFYYHRGAESVWLRLSFIGMALVPANFLSLALAARRGAARGGYWHLALYLPPLALALVLDLSFAASRALSHSWRMGFYDVSAPGALAFGAMTAIYLAAALWVSWRHSRVPDADNDWLFYHVQFPLALGMLLVLAVGYLRQDRSPTVSLWAMVMSQYAMFMMIRHGLVRLEISLTRGVTLIFSGLLLAGCVALFVGLSKVLFGRTLSQEMTFILVVAAVSLCLLYAAIQPRLESLLERLLRRRREP